MRISWMFMIFLGCKLSHATQSQSDSSCQCNEVKVHSVEANTNATVSVPCTHAWPYEEMTFNLLKNEDVIYSYRCYEGNNCTGTKHSGVEPHTNESNWFIAFNVTGPGHNITGFYRCQSQKTLPPPLEKTPGAPVVVKCAKDLCHQDLSWSPTQSSCVPPNTAQQFLWIWITVIVLVSTYSITVTIIALVNWLKLKKTDSQSDYMNTKPRMPRDRKKKRGVQNIQRHF